VDDVDGMKIGDGGGDALEQIRGFLLGIGALGDDTIE